VSKEQFKQLLRQAGGTTRSPIVGGPVVTDNQSAADGAIVVPVPTIENSDAGEEAPIVAELAPNSPDVSSIGATEVPVPAIENIGESISDPVGDAATPELFVAE
jgi:hypothetical protein